MFAGSNINDIQLVRSRIPDGGRNNITFASSVTNAPTITIGSTSQTISHLFMDEDSGSGEEDGLGIRVSGNSLPYSTGASSAWVGAGIINKPIGDFFTGTFDRSLGARFAANNSGSIRVVVNSQVIPEPEEYALVFGLFALGFVITRHHWQRKQWQQATTS